MATVGPTSAPDDVLRVEHIAKRFGPVTALRDINLHLKKGEVLGLLGDNGAGKSTLIKILCGFQKPDSGEMFLHGQPFAPKSVDEARALRSASTSRGSTSPWPACPGASARRSPWRERSTPTRTSSCWTSRWRRWGPKRAR
jgi:hypothetical protein